MQKQLSIVASALLLAASAAHAQAPSTAPAGSTALCKDGSYSTGATRKGACDGHKGTKTWYGAKAAAAAPAVQTQSARVDSTGTAPTTGEPSKTPATPAK